MQTPHQRVENVPAQPFAPSSQENEEIRRELGATPIYVLRQSFGAGFAYGMPGDVTVSEALAKMDLSSKAMLARKLHG
jgi:hypothetical protein